MQSKKSCGINIDETIRRNKLVYEDDEAQTVDATLGYIICIFTLVILTILVFDKSIFSNNSLRIFLLIIAILAYINFSIGIVRRLKSHRLEEIKTELGGEEITMRILDYAHRYDYSIDYRSYNCIIADRPSKSSPDQLKGIIFIISEGSLYYVPAYKSTIGNLINPSTSKRMEKDLQELFG